MNGDVCWVRCTQTNSHNIIHHLDGKDKSLPQWVDLGGAHGPSLGLSLSLEISVIFDTNSTPVLTLSVIPHMGGNFEDVSLSVPAKKRKLLSIPMFITE